MDNQGLGCHSGVGVRNGLFDITFLVLMALER